MKWLVGRSQAVVRAGLVALLAVSAAAWAAEPQPEDPAPLEFATCPLRATVNADNDIDLDVQTPDGRATEPVPQPVRAALVAIAEETATRIEPARLDKMTCALMMPKTYKVAASPSRTLYVAILRNVYGYRYVLIMHDRESGRITTRLPQFSARSLRGGPPLEKPYVSFTDLRQDGGRQVVFQEPVHFFEVYLGVIYHYYDISPDMELIHVMARETRFSDQMYGHARVKRDLTLLEPGRIKLETSLLVDGQPPRPLGYVELESKKAGAPFKVVLRRSLTNEFYSDLVTIDGRGPDAAIGEAAEERFLRAD